jgi:hypothetical protein
MTSARLLGVLLTLLVAGCAGGKAGSANQPAGNPRLITVQEIEQSYARDAYELVSRLRPNWIAPRGPQSFQDPTAGQVNVYVEDLRVGGADVLRRIHVSAIDSIEYLNDIQASARFGVAARGGGIIMVRNRLGVDR